MEFVSLIPSMNKEVAMAAIAQFPNYADMAKGMTDGLIKLCDNAVKEVSVGNRETIELYKEILVNLQNQLKEETYSPEQKIKINEQMIEVANKISMTNTERNTLTEFNSHNTELLNVEQVKEKLLTLQYIRDELDAMGRKY